MAATVVIPARFASTRFPAKILASATGRPLVQHVVDQVRRCRHVHDVVVATDDERIVCALAEFGTRTVLTKASHQSGTDRVAEVAAGLTDSIIVNVQGDEPEIEPGVIDGLIERLESTDEDMATAATAFPAQVDVADPNLVKVVVSEAGRALYFSRWPIPYRREPGAADDRPGVPAAKDCLLHLGIYAYRREFLLEFASWPPTRYELSEKLEQLRVLEHGRSIGVRVVDRATHGIDTAEQYAEFVRRYRRAHPTVAVNLP